MVFYPRCGALPSSQHSLTLQKKEVQRKHLITCNQMIPIYNDSKDQLNAKMKRKCTCVHGYLSLYPERERHRVFHPLWAVSKCKLCSCLQVRT